MEVPKKNCININVELMPFKKFIQSKNYIYHEDTILVNGSFKEKGSNQIISGDIFNMHLISDLNLEEIYKLYIDWFNLTRVKTEKERLYVSIKKYPL